MAIERRYVILGEEENTSAPALRIERRAEGTQEQEWLVGYAATFNSDSVEMEDFVEQIAPSAFDIVAERRGRKRPLQTRGLYNHDPNHVLGRFPETLRMRVDEVGLRYEVLLPKTRADIAELVERGDIRGSSFSFTVAAGGESWTQRDDGRHVRTITRIDDLYDVGPVTFPAYPSTEGLVVARRGLEQFKAELKSKSRAWHEAEEKRRSAVAAAKMAGESARDFLRKYGYEGR